MRIAKTPPTMSTLCFTSIPTPAAHFRSVSSNLLRSVGDPSPAATRATCSKLSEASHIFDSPSVSPCMVATIASRTDYSDSRYLFTSTNDAGTTTLNYC
jgi:hypothetical protein